MTLLVHIVAGGLGLASGYLALYAAKGSRLHRRSGMVFVAAMLTMCVAGMTVAAVRDVSPAINISAALLTAYLVITALTTVRPPAPGSPISRGSRWLDIGALLVAVAVGVIDLRFGLEAIAGGGTRDGIPAFPFFMFGVVGLLAGAGDLRVLRSGALTGTSRLARHLWRMSFALFIAALSFFIGQADELPKAMRIPALLALPVVAVLVTMLYWLWRVSIRRSFRGIVGVRAPEVA